MKPLMHEEASSALEKEIANKLMREEAIKAVKACNERNSTLCKNGRSDVFPVLDEKKKKVSSFDFSRKGCPNARRNGSAYCQACADKHLAQ